MAAALWNRQRDRSKDATTMFTKTNFMFSILVIFSIASAALAMAKEPTYHQAALPFQRQVLTSAYESGDIAPAPAQVTHATAVYFDPNPTPFNAFTYAGSVQLGPSISKRVLQGELRFPVFSGTPNVSVQIVSSTAAAPMQVYALKIEEISGSSGAVETRIIVEAETIFDVPANGIYYANLVVTGVPVIPPTNAKSAQFSH
jgi:hypothetical protein